MTPPAPLTCTTMAILVALLSGCGSPTPTVAPGVTPPAVSSALTPATSPGPASPPPQTATPSSTPTFTPTSTPTPTPPTLTPTPCRVQVLNLYEKLQAGRWVAYTPTHYDPNQGIMPPLEEIRKDLDLLYETGFTGIVTYGANGVLSEVPALAREAGLAVVMGIWMPGDLQETEAAVAAAPYVDGYVIGNEGLFFGRYGLQTLEKAVMELRRKTCLPVTTTEVLSLYYTGEELLRLGDWVFPNAHPYWQGITDPMEAVIWTQDTFDSLKAKAGDLPVVLKEVGLPTAGAPKLSEYQQAEYYARLRESRVDFVYFESFDQPWKAEEGVGPHWGLFQADRSPKVVSGYVVQGFPPFYVYADAGAPQNHCLPSSAAKGAPEGFMGCWQGIEIDQEDQSQPQSGTTSIRITYAHKPECAQQWTGIYWWDPPGSRWCDKPGGFDLTGWTRLTFWARGEKEGQVAEFQVGGLETDNGQACDSLQPARTTYPLQLSTRWTQYSISLYGRDLSRIAGGFVWVTSAEETTIYLDEIRFEWSERR